MRHLFTIGSLALCLTPAFGQEKPRIETTVFDTPRPATLKELFSGKPFPMTKKLRELNEDWSKVTVYGQPDTPASSQSIPTVFRRVGGETVYYTKGETVQVGSETYAITYRLRQKATAPARLKAVREYASNSESDRPTPNASLSLTLLNLRTSGNFTDIQPFNLAIETGDEENVETETSPEKAIVEKHIAKETPKSPVKDLVKSSVSPKESPKSGLKENSKEVSKETHAETDKEIAKDGTESKASQNAGEDESGTQLASNESPGKVIKVMSAGSPELVSINNLSQIGSAIAQYLEDFNEIFPPMKSRSDFKNALQPYLKSESVFLNPLTKEPYVLNDILSEHKLAHISNPTTFIAAYEAEAASDSTRGVVFVDGHAKRVPEAEWALWKKRSKIP